MRPSDQPHTLVGAQRRRLDRLTAAPVGRRGTAARRGTLGGYWLSPASYLSTGETGVRTLVCVQKKPVLCTLFFMQFFRASMREARARFAELLDDAEHGKVTFVTRHGRASAAIAPAPLLEQFGKALNALPPDGGGGADIMLMTEDGAMVLVEVKAYNDPDRLGRPGEVEEVGRGQDESLSRRDVLVVMGPPGTGKSAVLRRIIEQAMTESAPLLILNPENELAAGDESADGNPVPAVHPVQQARGAENG